MSALSLYIDAAQATINYANALRVLQDALVAKYNAIDPKANDAQVQFDLLSQEKASLTSDTTIGLAGLNALIRQVNSLSDAAKAEDPVLYERQDVVLISTLASTSGLVTRASAAVQAAITAAAAPTPGDPAGTSTSPATTPPPNAQLTGAADGDSSGSAGATTAGVANAVVSPPSPAYSAAKDSQAANVTAAVTKSTTVAGPNKRLQNPLGNFSSYTYHLTLYMITPDAYEAFILSDRTNILSLSSKASGSLNSGAYVIAQSGGTNASQARAPGFELDFYIDDLSVLANINSKNTKTASNLTALTFNIFEPYGFSFINRLNSAMAKLSASSKTRNFKLATDPTKQLFILGVSFIGYDKNGTVVSSNDTTATTGSLENNVIADRFYDIVLTGIKFKIDGRATTYNVTAALQPTQTAFGMKHGRANNGVSLIASTVGEALGGQGPDGMAPAGTNIQGLLCQLNAEQQLLANPVKPMLDKSGKAIVPPIANVYKIRYIGDAATDIANAKLITKATLDKSRWPMNTADSIQKSNEATSVNGVPIPDSRSIAFKTSTSIMQIINTIISQSTYLSDALTVLEKSSEEAKSSPNADPINDAPSKPIKWYNLGSEVKCLGWDISVNDFAYEITYVIQTYETPAAISVYSNVTTPYYGPAKKYEYWFTGKNSEILSYEHKLDNLYFNTALYPSGTVTSHGGGPLSTIPNTPINGDRTGSLGNGMETQNSYVSNLYDPGAMVNAKITILGDPDFLVQDPPNSINSVYDKFYGKDGFTINPNAGQVFIEIDFKEAVDYDNNSGLMTINDSIQFMGPVQPGYKRIVNGVSYMLVSVKNNFSKGKFTQDISAVLHTVADIPMPGAAREATAELTREFRRSSPTNSPTESPSVNNISAYVAPQDVVANTTGTVPVVAAFNAAKDSQLANLPPAFNAARDSQAASVVQDDDSSYNSVEAVRLARLNAANSTAADAGRETITAATNTGRSGQ